MENFKRILNKILFPHIAIVILLIPLSVAALLYAFLYHDANEILVYFSYFLSAYTLSVMCAKIPWIIRFVKHMKENNKYINRYVNDVHLRVKVSLHTTVIMNGAYAVFQLVLGIYHSSVWFYALAVYYFCLVLMRFFLLRDARSLTPGEDMGKELLRYRFCGVVLIGMNLALVTIVFYIAWQNRGFAHHYVTTIAMALYTFTAFTVAVVNVIKYRKYNSPMLSAAKAIGLASATVSMLTLETAMFTAFGAGNNEYLRRTMTAVTGVAVCIFVLLMSIYMIMRANRKIEELKINNS